MPFVRGTRFSAFKKSTRFGPELWVDGTATLYAGATLDAPNRIFQLNRNVGTSDSVASAAVGVVDKTYRWSFDFLRTGTEATFYIDLRGACGVYQVNDPAAGHYDIDLLCTTATTFQLDLPADGVSGAYKNMSIRAFL